ncbi:DUF6311 domain-containing protein [Sphingomonas sp.]|jgi:hypothetical protein|uniref:DUF6311 domain-containing protein n=1 Tax=Sphingomonas sp. TaxID=28214 RepID=UPI002D7F2766|nr:DUF6311 domain-containing protein [Sphingomonas sp.]HEU0045948.1 DUF6311 domain-containing protein [Sphingomonas sp.]
MAGAKNTTMRRAAFPLSVLVMGALLYLAWMHPAVLWPTNVGWLLIGEDRGQSALGLAAYLRAGGPGLHQSLLLAPDGTTLLFTDSIPLLGLLLKPWSGLLPPGTQFLGAWYLLCVLLQVGFAAALIRRYAAEPIAAWAGVAVLAAMPVLFNRYGHPSLCAQWLLLWALWVYVDPGRAARPAWWAAILAVAALVHSYFLLMVAAVWASALLEQWVRGRDRLKTLAGAAAALLPALALLWLNDAFGGPYGSTHSYGQFPAALDAWWNPANPGYTALSFSSPAMPEGRGFEGFNYLGAGLLVLVALAALQVATGRLEEQRRALLSRLAWLLPAYAVLALVAIGPAPVWRGQPLFLGGLPGWLVDALDPVRASGRLLWPLTYTLAFAAIVCATTWRKSALVLTSALALQVVDLAPMLSAVRATSARADSGQVYARTTDPAWQRLIAQAGDVQFEPAEPFRDLQLMQEISWRAVLACRPTRYTYSSRLALATRRRLAADAAAFRAGRLVPTRLYVLLGDEAAPAAVAGRIRSIDSVRVIPPARIAPPASCS